MLMIEELRQWEKARPVAYIMRAPNRRDAVWSASESHMEALPE